MSATKLIARRRGKRRWLQLEVHQKIDKCRLPFILIGIQSGGLERLLGEYKQEVVAVGKMQERAGEV